MSTNIKPENRRLLEAVEYIDENIILGVLSELRMPTDGTTAKKHTGFAHAKHIALIAACALILGTAIPVVNYVLPKLGAMIGGNAGAGEISLNYTSPYGEVPDEFKHIVEQNLFNKATVYGDRLIKEDFYNETDLVTIEMLNYSGETVAVLEFSSLTYGHLDKILMTDSGNFLAVFGGGPVYPDPMHPYYPPTRIVEFDKNGNILNEATFDDLKTSALEFIFPTPDGYIFVGSMKKENSPKWVYEYNVTVIELDKDLNITNQLILGEENAHNDLSFASFIDGKLNVYNRSLIDTGEGVLKRKEEFSKLIFDSKLILIEETVSDKRFDYSTEITRDEDYYAYYEKANLEKARSFVLIEYEGFDLVVTRFFSAGDFTCNLDSNGAINPLSLYYETVYSAFSKDGELLWRASVDGTDYELLAVIQADYEKYMSKYGAKSNQPIDISELTDEELAILLDMMYKPDRERILASLPEERRERVTKLLTEEE